MIKNPDIVEEAEREYDRSHPLTLDQKYRIIEGLYFLAREVGHFNSEDNSFDSDDIELAKALNANLSPPFGKDR